MEINQLRDEVVKTINEKYPSKWNLDERFMSLVKQVGDFAESLQFQQGKISKSSQHDTVQHQIVCIMIDLFMLSDSLNANLEKELQSAIKFFKTGEK